MEEKMETKLLKMGRGKRVEVREGNGKKKEELSHIMCRYKFTMVNVIIIYGKYVLTKFLKIKYSRKKNPSVLSPVQVPDA